MSLQTNIHHGILTLNDLSNVIDTNLYLAHKLDIRIKYKANSLNLLCEMFRYGQIIYKQEFGGKFLHIRLANMHAQLHSKLHEIDQGEKMERERKAREKAEEERLNKMPLWQQRYKNG